MFFLFSFLFWDVLDLEIPVNGIILSMIWGVYFLMMFAYWVMVSEEIIERCRNQMIPGVLLRRFLDLEKTKEVFTSIREEDAEMGWFLWQSRNQRLSLFPAMFQIPASTNVSSAPPVPKLCSKVSRTPSTTLSSETKAYQSPIRSSPSKAAPNSSRSSVSSLSKVTADTSPRPNQSDSVRSRSIKTPDSYNFNCYYIHRYFGYCYYRYCYIGLCYLDCNRQSEFEKSGSCYKHVLMNNIGMAYGFIQTGFIAKPVCPYMFGYFCMVRRSYFNLVFGYGKIELIGKNWWRYYKLYESLMILKYFCKVSDLLNRVYQYIY